MSKMPRFPSPKDAWEGNSQNGFQPDLTARHRTGSVWQTIFFISTLLGIVALGALLVSIINQSFGYIAVEYEVPPETLAVGGVPLDELPKDELVQILQAYISSGTFRRMERDQPFAERSRANVYSLVVDRVIEEHIIDSWYLAESIINKQAIEAEVAANYPDARLVFDSWVDPQFLSSTQSSDPARAGVRTALLGSLWTVGVTILVAFPLGVGAAIYLEEYASDNFLNRVIQTNIQNLAGVPSIIYGMLGLAIFVRTLTAITSGAVFRAGATTANGRTILSAGLTLALLVLPIIIINAQQAIRAVPTSLRWASFGLGATRWQTIWHHILPAAIPGILTGAILSISRAIGETAPLVVVGAVTFISSDPEGLFSRFTTLPIQIYQWTSRPQEEFRHLAGAAIIVLLLLLFALNIAAIVLRNRYQRR